ncbi:hypothetical protein L6452_43717 [Arctium lappa]|uniref:Uncharacterized protein n=1 Tax=Arctium lappa TaxID=4217 RepID=A0ACB8XDA3_ARCLA|nr:hypothetical protein L6452_43717 [Arctium lappa]
MLQNNPARTCRLSHGLGSLSCYPLWWRNVFHLSILCNLYLLNMFLLLLLLLCHRFLLLHCPLLTKVISTSSSSSCAFSVGDGVVAMCTGEMGLINGECSTILGLSRGGALSTGLSKASFRGVLASGVPRGCVL